MSQAATHPGVLFVCLGNICRSPLAEAAFRAEAARIGLEVLIDSAGTGNWHVGQPPDRRACAEAARHGIDISQYRARQVTEADFRRFTHICALDADNLQDLRRLAPGNATARLTLLLDYVPGWHGRSVDDPYYGTAEDFARCWQEISRAAQALAASLGSGNGLSGEA